MLFFVSRSAPVAALRASPVIGENSAWRRWGAHLAGLGLAGLGLGLLLGGIAMAEPLAPLPDPVGPVLLEVAGKLGVTNGDDMARFDQAMLEALGTETITTATLWTDGVQHFTGVPLYRLMQRLGVETGTISAFAMNDYRVDIPLSDAVEGGPILAFAQNGVALTVRDMGPLWLVYPYDSNVAYQTELVYARSIWQLLRFDIRD